MELDKEACLASLWMAALSAGAMTPVATGPQAWALAALGAAALAARLGYLAHRGRPAHDRIRAHEAEDLVHAQASDAARPPSPPPRPVGPRVGWISLLAPREAAR